MTEESGFDIAAGHKYFSADCFNKAWALIDKPDRTPEEDEQMLRLCLASHWHWTQREDYSDTSKSTAYWQTSRACALLGMADDARRYGRLCLEASTRKGILPLYLGYAYEALARAEAVAGDGAKMEEYLAKAREVAGTMPDPEAKKMLLDDLETIKTA
jgi:hypothetical protein